MLLVLLLSVLPTIACRLILLALLLWVFIGDDDDDAAFVFKFSGVVGAAVVELFELFEMLELLFCKEIRRQRVKKTTQTDTLVLHCKQINGKIIIKRVGLTVC